MTTETQFRAIVIGAGQAGNPLSQELARAGWKTALIEREFIGGTCINFGCTPTKTMVASARVAYLARRGKDYGVTTSEVSVDLGVVRERKRAIVENFRIGSQSRIEQTENLTLFFGEASFLDKNSILLRSKDGKEHTLRADTILINTGCRPSTPDIAGLDSVPYLTSTSIMELDKVPEKLIVLGGGYIGLEFAQMFHRFGSQVSIVHRGEYLLNREDQDVGEEITKIFQNDGITLCLNAEAVEISKNPSAISVTLKTPKGENNVQGTHLLVALGRVPNTEALNLPAAGIETDQGNYIRVNERLETSVPGIYALGDVNGGPAFTHVSYDDYRIIRDNLLHAKEKITQNRLIPSVVFIDPQLGRVGLNEKEAKKQQKHFEIKKIPMNYVARALEMDESRGFIKVLVDPKTKQILGASVLGIEGGELMASLQMAMLGKIPYPIIKNTIFAHPSLAESLNTVF